MRWALVPQTTHRLAQRPPYHPACRCTVEKVLVGKEVWEASQTHPADPWPCKECRARVRARIGEWFATRAHGALRLGELPSDPDFRAVVEMGQHLSELIKRYPRGIPPGGIELSFRLSSQPHEFASWNERERRMNLAGEYFVSGGRYASLRRAMAGFVDAGDNPLGCDSPEYLVSHEYGHSVYYRLDAAKYDQWRQSENMGEICTRAWGSTSEAFAEGYAMIQHTPAATWPRAVGRLHAMLREDGMG